MSTSLMRPLPYQQEAIDKLYKVPARLVGDEMGVLGRQDGNRYRFGLRH